MSLIEDFTQYKTDEGLISDWYPVRRTGNGLMYTAEYVWALWREYSNKTLDLNEFVNEVSEVTQSYLDCETTQGMFRRSYVGGFAKQHQAPDDYYGVALFSAFFDDGVSAQFWLSALRKYSGMLNEQDPDVWRWKSYFARMPQLVAHMQFAAGEKPTLFRLLIWALAILSTRLKPRYSQDSFVKAWMMCKVADNRKRGTLWTEKLIDAVIVSWRMSLKKRFPGGLGQIRKEHGWSDQHPTVVHLWGDI